MGADVLRTLRKACNDSGAVLIFDEVVTGFGRLGHWFVSKDMFDVEPDIICMAKGIASGFPLSALGTRRELDDLWPTGSHGGTYGGVRPVWSRAAVGPGAAGRIGGVGHHLQRGDPA
mgnify:CR=1 FL=1